MPSNEELAMEYNLSSLAFLCRKLDVHPIALCMMISERCEPIDVNIISSDDHISCKEAIKNYLREGIFDE